MNWKHFPLLVIVFTLCGLEFLQSGMVAFASAPIRGEIEASPEEYSLVAALYACLAVVVIAKLHWFTERIGWRLYVMGSIALFILGAGLCSISQNLTEFTAGRLVMCLGGASFMTTARVLINLIPPGPARFTGIKVFATGLAAGTAAAPLLSSYAVAQDQWQAIFWILMLLALIPCAIAFMHLPKDPLEKEELTQSSPWTILTLAVSSFFILYTLQKSYYDFYSNTQIMLAFGAIGALALFSFFHFERHKEKPLLNVSRLTSARYVLGVCMFSFCYVVLGANNYVLPSFLQAGLGYSWETIGHFQAFGLAATLLTWFTMLKILPKYPAPRKFFLVGFSCLAGFGWLLMSITPSANLWQDILPALVLNGCFIMLVLATTAMQTFRDVAHEDELFTHAQQVKNMLGQIAMAVGTCVATIFMQWRSTVHYGNTSIRIANGDAAYNSSSDALSAFFSHYPQITSAAGATLATQAQALSQQANILAGIDYFLVVIVVAVAGGIFIALQRVFR